jgi:hypothetical protein
MLTFNSPMGYEKNCYPLSAGERTSRRYRALALRKVWSKTLPAQIARMEALTGKKWVPPNLNTVILNKPHGGWRAGAGRPTNPNSRRQRRLRKHRLLLTA